MRRWSVGFLGCLSALALAQPSDGATVEVRDPGGGDWIHYVAGPGERNDLSFVEIEDSWPTAYLVRDPGAVIAAGSGCVSLDAHRAVCISGSGSMYEERVRLGDGDDVLRPAGFTLMRANGGPGDDRLLGGTWDDRLNGGGGIDDLRGGAGDDVLQDGDSDSTAGADVLDGGAGDDWVSYEQRTQGVRVDLGGAAADGALGEGDAVQGIENVHGGSGDDVLVGDDASNVFDDEGGRNEVDARGGDDLVRSGEGPVACGGGRDEVHGVKGRARLDPDCELVFKRRFGETFVAHAYPQPTTDGFALRFYCPDDEDGEDVPCSGTVTLREAGARHRLLARAIVPVGVHHRTARLTLTRAGRRLLLRGARAAVLRLRGPGMVKLSWGIVVPRRTA